MSDPKIIYQSSKIEIKEMDDLISIREKNPEVLIFPYILDDLQNPEKIGLLSNQLNKKYPYKILKGEPIDSDIDIFSTAKRKLLELSKIELLERDKWEYLGDIIKSEYSNNVNPAFGVNITEFKDDDNLLSSEIVLVRIDEIIKLKDPLISCLFLRLFQNKILEKL